MQIRLQVHVTDICVCNTRVCVCGCASVLPTKMTNDFCFALLGLQLRLRLLVAVVVAPSEVKPTRKLNTDNEIYEGTVICI